MSTVPTPLPLLCSCPIPAQVSSPGQSSHTAYTQPSPRVLLGGTEGNCNVLSPAGGSCQEMGTGSPE